MFNRDQVLISNEIKEIESFDQTVRKYKKYINAKYGIRDFYMINDSLFNAGLRGNFNNYFDFSKLQSVELQISKMQAELKAEYLNEIKKSDNFLTYIDSLNRERLYNIIKKYGYPSFYNRKWNDTINTRTGMTYLLTHTDPKSYIGILTLKLMLKEYKKGRVEDGEMKHYLWHVKGRMQDDPFGNNLDIAKCIKELKLK